MKRLLFSAAATLAACAGEAAPSVSERIDAVFAAYEEAGGPGYAIAVVRDGEILHAEGYGLADIETGREITPQTAFNLASLSKQFTGAAVALDILAERYGLEDSLADHWDGLPAFMAPVRIDHLVYMTSGLPEYYTLRSPKGGWSSEDRFTVDDAIGAVIESGALNYTPGSRWTYSNINYQLLAELSARTNGADFSGHMESVVFAPLGMGDSWVDAPIEDRPTKSNAYVWSDDRNGWAVAPRLSPHYGGSGVFSTLEDLAKWDAALYRTDALGDGFGPLMLSRKKFAHDKDNDAFGLVHGSYRGEDWIWYEGGDYGVSTYMVRLPDRDETIICLANFGGANCGAKTRAVADILFAFE